MNWLKSDSNQLQTLLMHSSTVYVGPLRLSQSRLRFLAPSTKVVAEAVSPKTKSEKMKNQEARFDQNRRKYGKNEEGIDEYEGEIDVKAVESGGKQMEYVRE